MGLGAGSFTPDAESHVDETNITEMLHAQEAISGPLEDVEKLLMIEAAMGNDVLNFLNTEAGRIIRFQIKSDVRDSHEKLARVSPWRRRKIQELQNRIAIGESFLGYLAEMVARGEHAYVQLLSADQGA